MNESSDYIHTVKHYNSVLKEYYGYRINSSLSSNELFI